MPFVSGLLTKLKRCTNNIKEVMPRVQFTPTVIKEVNQESIDLFLKQKFAVYDEELEMYVLTAELQSMFSKVKKTASK